MPVRTTLDIVNNREPLKPIKIKFISSTTGVEYVYNVYMFIVPTDNSDEEMQKIIEKMQKIAQQQPPPSAQQAIPRGIDGSSAS